MLDNTMQTRTFQFCFFKYRLDMFTPEQRNSQNQAFDKAFCDALRESWTRIWSDLPPPPQGSVILPSDLESQEQNPTPEQKKHWINAIFSHFAVVDSINERNLSKLSVILGFKNEHVLVNTPSLKRQKTNIENLNNYSLHEYLTALKTNLEIDFPEQHTTFIHSLIACIDKADTQDVIEVACQAEIIKLTVCAYIYQYQIQNETIPNCKQEEWQALETFINTILAPDYKPRRQETAKFVFTKLIREIDPSFATVLVTVSKIVTYKNRLKAANLQSLIAQIEEQFPSIMGLNENPVRCKTKVNYVAIDDGNSSDEKDDSASIPSPSCSTSEATVVVISTVPTEKVATIEILPAVASIKEVCTSQIVAKQSIIPQPTLITNISSLIGSFSAFAEANTAQKRVSPNSKTALEILELDRESPTPQ